MLVYFDPANGRVLHTVDGRPRQPPPGDYIEAPEGTDIAPIEAYAVSGGALIEADVTPAIEQAVTAINVETGAARGRYITTIPGQEMIYADKEREAVRFLAEDPEPTDMTPYPWIAREAGSTAPTAAGVAQAIIARAAEWRAVGSQMEGLRLEYAARVRACATVADVRSELVAFRVALAAL